MGPKESLNTKASGNIRCLCRGSNFLSTVIKMPLYVSDKFQICGADYKEKLRISDSVYLYCTCRILCGMISAKKSSSELPSWTKCVYFFIRLFF
jgi:hypothetical protein